MAGKDLSIHHSMSHTKSSNVLTGDSEAPGIFNSQNDINRKLPISRKDLKAVIAAIGDLLHLVPNREQAIASCAPNTRGQYIENRSQLTNIISLPLRNVMDEVAPMPYSISIVDFYRPDTGTRIEILSRTSFDINYQIKRANTSKIDDFKSYHWYFNASGKPAFLVHGDAAPTLPFSLLDGVQRIIDFLNSPYHAFEDLCVAYKSTFRWAGDSKRNIDEGTTIFQGFTLDAHTQPIKHAEIKYTLNDLIAKTTNFMGKVGKKGTTDHTWISTTLGFAAQIVQGVGENQSKPRELVLTKRYPNGQDQSLLKCMLNIKRMKRKIINPDGTIKVVWLFRMRYTVAAQYLIRNSATLFADYKRTNPKAQIFKGKVVHIKDVAHMMHPRVKEFIPDLGFGAEAYMHSLNQIALDIHHDEFYISQIMFTDIIDLDRKLDAFANLTFGVSADASIGRKALVDAYRNGELHTKSSTGALILKSVEEIERITGVPARTLNRYKTDLRENDGIHLEVPYSAIQSMSLQETIHNMTGAEQVKLDKGGTVGPNFIAKRRRAAEKVGILRNNSMGNVFKLESIEATPGTTGGKGQVIEGKVNPNGKKED